jgi:hypothetical protein
MTIPGGRMVGGIINGTIGTKPAGRMETGAGPGGKTTGPKATGTEVVKPAAMMMLSGTGTSFG